MRAVKGRPVCLVKHHRESSLPRQRPQSRGARDKEQLIESRNAQDLRTSEVGIAFVNSLIEWVGLLKTDLIGRKVDGVAPSVIAERLKPFAKVRES